MASIETVVQNTEGEMGDDTKPDSTADVKEEPGQCEIYYNHKLGNDLRV